TTPVCYKLHLAESSVQSPDIHEKSKFHVQTTKIKILKVSLKMAFEDALIYVLKHQKFCSHLSNTKNQINYNIGLYMFSILKHQKPDQQILVNNKLCIISCTKSDRWNRASVPNLGTLLEQENLNQQNDGEDSRSSIEVIVIVEYKIAEIQVTEITMHKDSEK
ncbi:hypothetical protein ACJX0J_037463, partial [Zea mays]